MSDDDLILWGAIGVVLWLAFRKAPLTAHEKAEATMRAMALRLDLDPRDPRQVGARGRDIDVIILELLMAGKVEGVDFKLMRPGPDAPLMVWDIGDVEFAPPTPIF